MASGRKVVRRVKATNDSSKSTTKQTPAKVAKTEVKAKPAETKKSPSKLASRAEASRKKLQSANKKKSNRKPPLIIRPLVSLWTYIVNSWKELQQVEWPSHKATMKLTFGIIVFCVVIGTLVLIIDKVTQDVLERIIL